MLRFGWMWIFFGLRLLLGFRRFLAWFVSLWFFLLWGGRSWLEMLVLWFWLLRLLRLLCGFLFLVLIWLVVFVVELVSCIIWFSLSVFILLILARWFLGLTLFFLFLVLLWLFSFRLRSLSLWLGQVMLRPLFGNGFQFFEFFFLLLFFFFLFLLILIDWWAEAVLSSLLWVLVVFGWGGLPLGHCQRGWRHVGRILKAAPLSFSVSLFLLLPFFF